MPTLEELSKQWHAANAAGDDALKNSLHQQAEQIRIQQDAANGTKSTYNAASGTWTTSPAAGTGQTVNGGLTAGATGSPAQTTTYVTDKGETKAGYYTGQTGTGTANLDLGQQMQLGMAQGLSYQQIQNLMDQRLEKTYANWDQYGKYVNDEINQQAQAYIDRKRQEEALNQSYADTQARLEAANRAAVEKAVSGLSGQKDTVNQSYADLFKQLYIDRRMAEKNLPQQMAAMGYTGGLAESSALALQTNYNQQLQSGEQERINSLNELDRAIQEARLNGDISTAEQLAQLAQNRYQSYADLIARQQEQDNWQKQFQYQQQQNAASMSRQQALDKIENERTSFQDKVVLAQYLYENSGDASGFRALGAYTDEQIAGLQRNYLQTQRSARTTGNGTSYGGTTTTTGGGYSEKDLNMASVLALGLGPISYQEVERLVEEGKVNAMLQNGKINVTWATGVNADNQDMSYGGILNHSFGSAFNHSF